MSTKSSRFGSPLPDSIEDFRALVKSMVTEDDRAALADAVRAEFPDYDSCCRPFRSLSGLSVVSDRLSERFEHRMLDIIDTPVLDERLANLQILAVSHLYARRDLVHLQSDRLVELLLRHIESADPVVRAESACELAWMGRDSQLATVLELLRSRDSRMVAGAARGCELAAFHRYASREYQAAVSDEMRRRMSIDHPLTPDEQGAAAASAILKALAQIDPATTISHLSSAACLHGGNPAVRLVLLHLQQAGIESESEGVHLDVGMLWPIFDTAIRGEVAKHDSWKQVQIAECCLALAAPSEPARVLRECRRLIELCRERGWRTPDTNRAVKRCKGVPHPDACLEKLRRSDKAYSGDAAAVLRAYELFLEVVSDGLELYFANYGDRASRASAGLRVLGMSELAEAFDHEYAAFSSDADGTRSVSDSSDIARLESSIEQIAGCVEQFMTDHPGLFKKAARR